MNDLKTKNTFRGAVSVIEQEMHKLPDAVEGDRFPLKHTFADGMYVREISVPRGFLVVTKIHKLAHPCFILKGDCSVMTENGPQRIKAPYHMITPAGTKRVVYVHEDTVWVTVHKTEGKDLERIEEEIISKNFNEFDGIVDTTAETELIDFVKKGECA